MSRCLLKTAYWDGTTLFRRGDIVEFETCPIFATELLEEDAEQEGGASAPLPPKKSK